MRTIRYVLVGGGIAILVILSILLGETTRYGRMTPESWVLVAIAIYVALAIVFAVTTSTRVEQSRPVRLLRLWLDAKERELNRRASGQD